MNLLSQNDVVQSAGVLDAEKTLRLIATLPAPEGIADRVKMGMQVAPRKPGILPWPTSLTGTRWTQLSALRAAAAAAIVVVVGGGAWEVYRHIQIAPEPAAVVAPLHADGGGISAAGAVRKPKTLSGSLIVNPTKPQTPADAKSVSSQSRETKRLSAKRHIVQNEQR